MYVYIHIHIYIYIYYYYYMYILYFIFHPTYARAPYWDRPIVGPKVVRHQKLERHPPGLLL